MTAQRFMAAKSERTPSPDSSSIPFWHFPCAPLPLIGLGVVSLSLFWTSDLVEQVGPDPGGDAARRSRPRLGDVDPIHPSSCRVHRRPGRRGAAAFMSTLSALINWGTSLVINDFYRRSPGRSAPPPGPGQPPHDAGPVRRGGGRSRPLRRGDGELVPVHQLGHGHLHPAPILAPLLLVAVQCLGRDRRHRPRPAAVDPALVRARLPAQALWQATGLLFLLSLVVLILVTLLTPPEKKATLVGFYERCRPPGRWKGIREAAKPAADGREAGPRPSKLLGDAAVGIGACLGLVVATNALFAGAWMPSRPREPLRS